MRIDTLTDWMLAAGGVGTAAFGIVEGLKWTAVIGEGGFAVLRERLGPLWGPLETAYGSDVEPMLRGLWRGDARELARVLRQGVRVGITPANAAQVAGALGTVDGPSLAAALEAALTDPAATDGHRAIIGRFELAADARIDAAIAAAQARYAASARLAASVVAIALALLASWALGQRDWRAALLIGIAAVPLAPIAKDVASGIQAAARGLAGR